MYEGTDFSTKLVQPLWRVPSTYFDISLERYAWLRRNPDFGNDIDMSRMTPDQFDKLVDKCRSASMQPD